MPLKVITGCMFSGKTTQLLKELQFWEDKRKVLAVTHKYDNRKTATHSGAKALSMKVNCVSDIPFESYDVIGIDEGQFFDDIDAIIPWLKTKVVIVAALNGNFKQEAFGNLYKIYPHVDHLILKKTYCKICQQNNAIYSKKITDDGKEIDIGGKNKYIPVCRLCY
tara:strand:- start:168 stop:662 length:495 start_codon:yes stop_codon:yes gene_type:complete